MTRNAAIIAIVVAQVLVIATFTAIRKKGIGESRSRAGLIVFGLEVGYVFISLLIAGLVT